MKDLNNATARSLPRILSTVVPEMRRNQAQHVADLNWALFILKLYPYRDNATPNTRKQLTTHCVDHSLNDLDTILDYALPEADYTQAAPQAQLNAGDDPLQVHSTTSQPPPTMGGLSINSHPPPHQSSLVVNSHKSQPQCRSIILRNSLKVTFTADEVCKPCAISFASDISGLNQMWDDTTEHRCGDSGPSRLRSECA